MPPKGRGGPNKPNNKKKGNQQQSDSDDDWVPLDAFGNPMPLADTSGWDELKTFDQVKRQAGVKSKSNAKREQRVAQQSKDDRAKNQAKKEKEVQQHQHLQQSQTRRHQSHHQDNSDDEEGVKHTYHTSDGASIISTRERSTSAAPRHNDQNNGHNGQNGHNGPKATQNAHNRPHKEREQKDLKPPKVYKPTSIVLTSFESKDHSFKDSAAGSQPRTVRTIFAKMTPEEKEQQKVVTYLPLATYSTTSGEFLPENITTLTPGYVAGQRKALTLEEKEQNEHFRFNPMPISPQYQKFNISFPRRPNIPNPRSLTPQQYRDIEEQTFHKWLEAIYTKFQPNELNNFEHNLYVWKQLWLCCESSDIILIILDSRNPLFHFNSHLYNYIVNELKKPFVLVLNKIDLVPIQITLAFKAYLEKTFPGVHVVLFSSYPSALHSFVLALQHQAHPHAVEASSGQDGITMESLIKHNVDVTANDIAEHQRTVVNRMKMTNIIDTVGVDELLQLCLHLTRGHAYQSPSEIYNNTLNGNASALNNKTTDKSQKSSSKSTNTTDLSNDINTISNDDINSRRILSEREQYKWSLKNKKLQFQQNALEEHLKSFISHAERRDAEIKQEEQKIKSLTLSEGPIIEGLEKGMEELHLDQAIIAPEIKNSTKKRSTTYFKDTDDVDNISDYDGSDADDDVSDADSDEDGYNGVVKKNKKQKKNNAQNNRNITQGNAFTASSKLNRLQPPQIGRFVKPLKEKLPGDSEDDVDDEDDDDDEDQDDVKNNDENDQDDEEDEDGIDYDHLDTYMPELSQTEDEIEAIELSHMVQDSPALSASRGGSPLIGGRGGKHSKVKPVFDLQRVLQHIYTKEESSREAHNKTKESLRQFEQHQIEAGANDHSKDSEEERVEKEYKLHKKQQVLTKAQAKEQEKQHHEYIRNNRIKIGFVGHPNVGKSSVVNAISRKKTVSVSRQPGHTKYNQTIKINELITLIDCPGLIFPALDGNKGSSTLFGLFPIPQLPLPVVVIYYLAQMIDLVGILDLENFHPLRYHGGDDDNDANTNDIDLLSPRTERQVVSERRDAEIKKATDSGDIKTLDDLLNMKIPRKSTPSQQSQTFSNQLPDGDNASENNIGFGWSANTICEAFALKRGFMSGKGTPDPQRAAQQILYLIADGKIQLYMLPPDHVD